MARVRIPGHPICPEQVACDGNPIKTPGAVMCHFCRQAIEKRAKAKRELKGEYYMRTQELRGRS